MGKRKYPDWYYGDTKPDARFQYRLPKKLRGLIYLLRNNGWNTTGSEGPHDECKGTITIQPYGEQISHYQEHGGAVPCLRNFLWEHGYKHFEIKRVQFSWHGKLVDDALILKLLSPGCSERSK